MAVPDYQTLMLPVLRFLGRCPDRELPVKEINEAMATEFKLTDAELGQLLASGTQTLFANRVNWARVHLKLAGLIETPHQGVARVTQRGLDVLARNPPQIDRSFLNQIPDYVAYLSERARRAAATRLGRIEEPDLTNSGTPLETLESVHQRLRDELASELLERMKECSPAFFERLVIELIVKMGYGGSRVDAGKAIGRSGDGGIDGIIKEDRLGLDTIYL